MPDFVIVGTDGTEHHFPEGMDPKAAIQVVKNSELKAANEKPLHEPTTFWSGAAKGANDYATEVGRGMFESAAHPKTAGDFAGLLLPTTVGTGGVLKSLRAASEAEPAGNRVVRGAVNTIREGGKAAGTAADAIPSSSIYAPAKLPLNVIKGVTSKLPSEAKMLGVDRYKPNVSGIPDSGIPQGEMPTGTPPIELETAQEALSRKTESPTGGAQTDRIPYASPTSRPPALGKVVGKAPTLDEVLQDALEGTKATDPTEVSTLAETPMTGGTQKPKVGKRPGGYTTDIPARGKAVEGEGAVAPEGVTRSPADRRAGTGKIDKLSETSQGADQLEQLLSALHPGEDIPHINPEGHGSMAAPSGFQETMRSTEPEMVEHFGTEPGTPEAASGRAHHKMAGEMDADYKRRLEDPLASFLLAALGGGTLASRSTTSNQGGLP